MKCSFVRTSYLTMVKVKWKRQCLFVRTCYLAYGKQKMRNVHLLELAKGKWEMFTC